LFSEEAIKAVKEGVEKGEPVRGPFDAQILPLNNCNQACLFCPLYAGDAKLTAAHAPRFLEPAKIMEWDTFERIADGLEKLGGVERVHFTGGEPLLHPKIADMVARLKRGAPKASIGIVTNGILLEKTVDKLVDAKVDRISVSLNAADKTAYLKLSPSNKAEDFDKVVEGITKTASLAQNRNGPDISITSVLTRHNCDSVEGMYEIALKTGARNLTFIPLTPFEYEGKWSNEALIPSTGQFQKFKADLEKIIPKAQKNGIWMGYGSSNPDSAVLSADGKDLEKPCYAGFAFIVFWPDGNIRPCCNCEQVIGNIICHSLEKIWLSEAYREFRLKALSVEIPEKMQCMCKECGYLYENGWLNKQFLLK